MIKYLNGGLTRFSGAVLVLAVLLLGIPPVLRADAAPAPSKEKPLMRNFIGVNSHYGFKADLYQPVCSMVRNYHPMVWDNRKDTSLPTLFPMSREEMKDGIIDWGKLYGGWKAHGFTIDACLQFDLIKPNAWKDLEKDAYTYGESYAQYFGPSHQNLVVATEIGNEPSEYDDATYRKVFENMAKGVRTGDPKLKIVTAAMTPGKSDKNSKSLSCLKGLENLYDVLNVHTYALTGTEPSLRYTYPEHPAIPYLKKIDEMIAWRNAHTPGKEVWVTAFGYDSSTKPAPPDSKWVGTTDTEQAQWLVRSFLVFSALDIDEASFFYFDDDDLPSLHNSSGITRHFQPKPSFYALAHLQKTLGDYRFSKVIVSDKNLYLYEYVNPDKPGEPIRVAWSPTGSQREITQKIPITGKAIKAERMPLKEGNAEAVNFKDDGGAVELPISESPTYIWLKQ